MIYLDIETNLAHDTIWCCVTKLDGHMTVWTGSEGLQEYLDGHSVCAHNLIGFDAPVMKRVWGIDIPQDKLVDTLVMSRLLNPVAEGGHSLKMWGKRLGFDKMDFDTTDFDGGLTEEMLEYCKRDVDVLEKVQQHIQHELNTWTDSAKQSLALEHAIAVEMAQQERNGYMLDVRYATDLMGRLNGRCYYIEQNLHQIFPPIVEKRFSEKTGKPLKDKVTEFNVGSRKQIAERLQSLGVKFTKMTEKGSIIVDEATLNQIGTPEAKAIAEYLMVKKRTSMINSWLDAVHNDDRVRGRVIPNGTITGRMTHSSPNLGQVPSVKSPYGKQCRKLWTVPKGYKLVGTDLSGIELRCLAHYMKDEAYTHELLDGDIHTANQNAAGLETRDQAKTFIYALLYGAGPAKIGSIVGGSAKQGQALIDKFMGNMPALDKLLKKVKRMAGQGYVHALDGRRVIVRSEHAALNSLLQSCGSIIAKQWCLEAHKLLRKEGIDYKQVAFVHDEIQLEVREDQAEQASVCMIAAAQLAGIALDFRVPVDAESKIGNNWYETH